VPVIPDGHILAPSKVVWLECDAYVAGATWHRRDWHANTNRTAEGLMRNTEPWMQTRYGLTWESLAADCGVSRRTLADRLRWRREHGLIAVVETGSTVETRKGTAWGRWDDELGNIAATYALIVPVAVLEELYGEFWAEDLGVEDGTCYVEQPERGTQASIVAGPWDEVPWPCETRLTRPEKLQVGPPVDQTRTLRLSWVSLRDESLLRVGARYTTAPYPLNATPTTRGERIAAGQRLRDEHMALRGLSARDLGRLGRPLFKLGATLGDLVYALNTHPELGQWASPVAVLGEHRGGWRGLARLRGLLEARVAAWIGPDGELVAELPSQTLARGRKALARDTGWRERLDATAAVPEPVRRREPVHAPSVPPAEVRAGLRERLAAARTSWVASRERDVPGALVLARRRAERERCGAG
jgi:hypothetical protein